MAATLLAGKSDAKAFSILGLCLLLTVSGVHGIGRIPSKGNERVFDVKKFGADSHGKVDSSLSFEKAWRAACNSRGPVKILIPRGEYRTGKMNFRGPCRSTTSVVIDIQGNIFANGKINGKEALEIIRVKNLIVTGTGTYNGKGEDARKKIGCKRGKCGHMLPVTMKFKFVEDGRVENIKLLNSQGYHMSITNCTNFVAQGLRLNAPVDHKNTDGIHISRSKHVTVSRCVISTGDDCVSVGEGSSYVEVNNVECGTGHGISVGSLGKTGDSSVSNVHVARCKFKNTANGARIKTFQNSPRITATNITFEDLTMENVQNPIIIDQNYAAAGKDKKPSLVQLRGIYFKNIRGTTITPAAVSLRCSSAAPCQGVELVDIDLKYVGGPHKHPFSRVSEYAQATFSGKQSPRAPLARI